MIPGKNPASMAPSRKRSPMNDHGPVTSAVPAETTPQVTMMRAIHLRAPTRSNAMLLGTSNRK